MGTWGTKIFQDDTAEDIKETYVDLLKQGYDNKEITQGLITEYLSELSEEEVSVFWFALASVQWDYGRLLNEVKLEAIKHIKSGENLKRWKEEATEKDYIQRMQALEELENKLNTPAPKEKKVRKYNNYKCPWQIGDVFAFEIEENTNKYMAFVKVGEGIYYPHNICPLVYVYNKIFSGIPKIEDLQDIKYLPQAFYPIAYKGRYEDLIYKCLLGIETNTKKYLNSYIYIGKLQDIKKANNEITGETKLKTDDLCLIEKIKTQEFEAYTAWKDIKYNG